MRIYDCRSISKDPNTECESHEKIMASAKVIGVSVYTLNRFVDLKEFSVSPVKKVLKTYPFGILPDQSIKNAFLVKKHKLVT